MKKTIAACLFLALFANGVMNAQAVLSVVPGSLKITPAKFNVGEKIRIDLTLKNTGTSAFNDPAIYIYYKTSAHPFSNILTTLNDTGGIIINSGKTYVVDKIYLFTDSIYFPPADTMHNIIVVWPTGLEHNGQPDPNAKYVVDSMPIIYKDSLRIPTALLMLDNISAEARIRIYPNPTTNELNIECLNKELTVKKVIITDLMGQKVPNLIFSEAKVNLENLPNGIYSISVMLSDNKMVRYKIVKE